MVLLPITFAAAVAVVVAVAAAAAAAGRILRIVKKPRRVLRFRV